MEVTGIEPVSEEWSKQTAPCSVCLLISFTAALTDRLCSKPAPVYFALRSGRPAWLSFMLVPVAQWTLTSQKVGRLYLGSHCVRIIVGDYFWYRMINEANRHPRHAVWISRSPSKPVHPHNFKDRYNCYYGLIIRVVVEEVKWQNSLEV